MGKVRYDRRGPDKDGIIKPFEQLTGPEMSALGMWPYEEGHADGSGDITTHDIEGFEHLHDFDMRNGDPSDVRSMLVRPTIAEGYHWVPVSGIKPEEAIDVVEAFVMSAYHRLMTKPPEKLAPEHRRKAAIVLGVSRAVMTQHYRLTPGDFIGGELATPVINVSTNPDTTYKYTVTAAVTGELKKEMAAGFVYTADEKAAVAALLSSSIGALPVQGYSLMMTGHHYLSEGASQSRRAFAVIEKQFWNHSDVKPWFTAEREMIQDCAWHKAGHPVIMNLKEQMAMDDKVAIMLREAGAGSAASRLPAQEAQLRTANSYLALMSAVDPLFRMFGGNTDPSELSEILRIIKAWPKEGGKIAIPEEWPANITTRKDAMDWLGETLVRNAPRVAYCYGFYCALTEQNQAMSAGATNDTLKTSFSLTKLKGQCHATFLEGLLAYTDYNAARNKKRMEGVFVSASLPYVAL